MRLLADRPEWMTRRASARRVTFCARYQLGAGLIEVMVAIVIVAFALLGMAGLQVSSLRYQKTAQVRGLSAQYSAEIADRIRANMTGALNNSYVTPLGNTYAAGAGADPGNCAGGAILTPAQTATCDIFSWRRNMNRSMDGWGEIAGNIANGFTVTIYFREPNKRDYDDTQDAACRAAALAGADNPNSVRCLVTRVIP